MLLLHACAMDYSTGFIAQHSALTYGTSRSHHSLAAHGSISAPVYIHTGIHPSVYIVHRYTSVIIPDGQQPLNCLFPASLEHVATLPAPGLVLSSLHNELRALHKPLGAVLEAGGLLAMRRNRKVRNKDQGPTYSGR